MFLCKNKQKIFAQVGANAPSIISVCLDTAYYWKLKIL